MEKEKLIQIVSKVQKGNEDAFNTLYQEYHADIYYFALKTVKNEELACDITQETFLTIFKSIESLKEPAAFVVWSRQIAYRHCLQYFKKKQDVLVSEDEDGHSVFDSLEDTDEENLPEEVLEKEEFKNTIMEMIDSLSEEQRSATLLFYFDELSVKQIAEIQQVSEGTVKSRLNYARKSIKTAVEDYEKKHNIKLHSFNLLPLLLFLFGQDKKANPMSKVAVQAVSKGLGIGTKVTAKATLKALPLGAKIAACVVAVGVATGAVIGGISLLDKPTEEVPVEAPNEEINEEEIPVEIDIPVEVLELQVQWVTSLGTFSTVEELTVQDVLSCVYYGNVFQLERVRVRTAPNGIDIYQEVAPISKIDQFTKKHLGKVYNYTQASGILDYHLECEYDAQLDGIRYTSIEYVDTVEENEVYLSYEYDSWQINDDGSYFIYYKEYEIDSNKETGRTGVIHMNGDMVISNTLNEMLGE